jgi:hypothetical protein
MRTLSKRAIQIRTGEATPVLNPPRSLHLCGGVARRGLASMIVKFRNKERPGRTLSENGALEFIPGRGYGDGWREFGFLSGGKYLGSVVAEARIIKSIENTRTAVTWRIAKPSDEILTSIERLQLGAPIDLIEAAFNAYGYNHNGCQVDVSVHIDGSAKCLPPKSLPKRQWRRQGGAPPRSRPG